MARPQRGEPGTWQWLGYWEGGQLDTAATLAGLPADDLAASLLICDERPGEIHHMPDARGGRWFIWEGRLHKPDRRSEIAGVIGSYAERASVLLSVAQQEVAARTRNLMLMANPAASETQIAQAEKKAWEPWAAAQKYHAGLRRSAGANSLREYLKGAPGVGVTEEDIADRWPEYLNCANGVVNLRTGQLLAHDPRWMMTYLVDVNYVPGAHGPSWNQLVWHVAGENANVARYLVRMLGYSLLGDNREQLVFFMKGPTASGKSQVLEAVLEVAGPAGHSSTGALISRNRSERHARVEYSITGKRFVIIDESAERIHVDEGQLKRLTGSATISVNKLYGTEELPAMVSWAIWQATNEMPTLLGFDDAIRRRLRAIPCGSTIAPEYREKNLGKRLAKEEGEAILAMLVGGCMEYLRDGEQRPDEVELATAEYESEQNTAAAFRADCCADVPLAMGGSGAPPATSQARLRQEYVAWCQALRISPMPVQAFGTAMRELPGISWDKANKRYLGLVVVTSYLTGRQDEVRMRQDGSG